MARTHGRSHNDQFPEKVAQWIVRNGNILDALLALRRLGDEGAAASLRRVLRAHVLDRTRIALWGTPWPDEPERVRRWVR